MATEAGRTRGNHVVEGALICTTISMATASIADGQISATSSSPISGSKVGQENPPSACGIELFGPTTTITDLTKTIGMAQAAGTLMSFRAWIEVLATDPSRTVTVDLHKSTGGGAYATALSATIGFTTSSTVRVAVTGAFTSSTFVSGDIFRIVVTVAGGAGNQAQGLTANLVVKENPQ